MKNVSRIDLLKSLRATFVLAQWCFNARYVKGSEESDNSFLRVCFLSLEQTLLMNLAILFEKRKDTMCFRSYLLKLSDEGKDEGVYNDISKLLLDNDSKIRNLISLRSNDVAHRNGIIYSDLINSRQTKFPRSTIMEIAQLMGVAEKIITVIELHELDGHTRNQRSRLSELTKKGWDDLYSRGIE